MVIRAGKFGLVSISLLDFESLKFTHKHSYLPYAWYCEETVKAGEIN